MTRCVRDCPSLGAHTFARGNVLRTATDDSLLPGTSNSSNMPFWCMRVAGIKGGLTMQGCQLKQARSPYLTSDNVTVATPSLGDKNPVASWFNVHSSVILDVCAQICWLRGPRASCARVRRMQDAPRTPNRVVPRVVWHCTVNRFVSVKALRAAWCGSALAHCYTLP